MYGAHVGSLIVYQMTMSKHEKILLILTGNQGNFWQSKALNLVGDGNEDFQVIFEGIVGRGINGGIALDDITLSRECLPSQKFLPAESTTVPPTGMFLLKTKLSSPERICVSGVFISFSLLQNRNRMDILLMC